LLRTGVFRLGFAGSEEFPSLCGAIMWGLMALLTAIDASHYQKDSNSKLVKRVKRDLKRLACSINYDSAPPTQNASSSRQLIYTPSVQSTNTTGMMSSTSEKIKLHSCIMQYETIIRN
jgi:ABC-type iron transport system FetAB ATPase subunit